MSVSSFSRITLYYIVAFVMRFQPDHHDNTYTIAYRTRVLYSIQTERILMVVIGTDNYYYDLLVTQY